MIAETGEILEWLKAGFSGWRYLISKDYRTSKHDEWKNEKIIYVVWDFFLGIAGIIFSIVVIYFFYKLLN